MPTGRQILQAAGALPVEEHSVFAILASGEFEDVRLDETYDLRGKGAERFIIFKTDRVFKFTLDSVSRSWGTNLIKGRTLKKLAGVKADAYQVYLEVRGGQDRLIRDDEDADLSQKGVESFITVIRDTTEGEELVLPENDRRYLEERGISYELSKSGKHIGVIFKAKEVPEKKFDHQGTDVLVLLPDAYPDAPPDMFFCDPWLKLSADGRYPTKADVAHEFGGRRWQRWSRHNSAWRPGVDGLHTMLKRIEKALEEAK
jgi:hypothetical protein